jgi:hypothetical protein
MAIFRPSTGLWALYDLTRYYFGGSSDVPVVGDYYGGMGENIAIYRPPNGLWAIQGYTKFYFGGP